MQLIIVGITKAGCQPCKLDKPIYTDLTWVAARIALSNAGDTFEDVKEALTLAPKYPGRAKGFS